MTTEDKTNLSIQENLPIPGKSRFSRFKHLIPVSKEKFRQLSKEGKAPQPERMGIRCTFYSNDEIRRWLDDPVNYRAKAENEKGSNV